MSCRYSSKAPHAGARRSAPVGDEVRGQVVLVQLEVASLAADRQRAPVLGHARPRDRVDDLERVLDNKAIGHVQERPAAPKSGVGGLQLVPIDRQPLGVPRFEQLRVLGRGLFQRAQDHASLGQRRVELDAHDRARRPARSVLPSGGRGWRLPQNRGCPARAWGVLARCPRVEQPRRAPRRSSSRSPSGATRAARCARRPLRGAAQLGQRTTLARARRPPARGRARPRGGVPA